jgi:hypothetical protein
MPYIDRVVASTLRGTSDDFALGKTTDTARRDFQVRAVAAITVTPSIYIGVNFVTQGLSDLDAVKALLTPPARRQVNEMKLQISEIVPGAHIGATFVDPVFGVYVVWSDIARACHGDLTFSAHSIESQGKPVSDVVRLDMSGRSVAATGPKGAASGLEHGTTVRATFADERTTVHILGSAVVASHAPMIGVGRWVLAYKGAPGVYLKALDVLAGPGQLGLACPPPSFSWQDATLDSTN